MYSNLTLSGHPSTWSYLLQIISLQLTEKEFNSPLPQIAWEALPEREQYIIQCDFHTHKMVKMVPTQGKTWTSCVLTPFCLHRKRCSESELTRPKVQILFSNPIPSLVCWEKCVPFHWFIIWQRQGNQSKEEWEGDSSEDPASLWTYIGLRVSKLPLVTSNRKSCSFLAQRHNLCHTLGHKCHLKL